MIEKLKNIPIDMNGEPSAVWLKINELVDAVNEMQNRSSNTLIKTMRMDKEFAEGECVRLQNELERTRWALDVAVNMLKDIDKTRSVANHKIGTQDKTLNSGIVFCWTTPDEIHNTIDQITTLTKGGDNE